MAIFLSQKRQGRDFGLRVERLQKTIASSIDFSPAFRVQSLGIAVKCSSIAK
jgi:hypothetical protein